MYNNFQLIFRPPASELLKHPFFKKAKDKKYLQQTLVAIGPSVEARVQKASKRQSGASGRLHRTVTGEWVWSSEEEDGGKSSDEEAGEKPMNSIEKASSGSEEDLAEADGASASTNVAPINLVLRMRFVNNKFVVLFWILFILIVSILLIFLTLICLFHEFIFTLK